MLKNLLCAAITVLMLSCLCGCGNFFAADTAELLSPPELSGELAPIAEEITKTAGGQYTFKYPSRGDYRSAVVQKDIDNDGISEAFAFYATAEGETMTMNINVIRSYDGEWKSAAVQSIVAGGVDRLEFCDLDGDGEEEILVGWEIYGTSEMQIAVYSLGENALTQRMLQRYTHFATCDLDEDGKNEVLLVKTNSAEQQNSAAIYSFTAEGVTELSSCLLDGTAKTVSEPIVAELSTGKPAIYIDEIKGVGAVTEVLFLEKGSLVNPLFQPDAGETLATLRSVSFSISDINGDGIIEIPVQESVPSVLTSEVNEKLYLTNWCSFNGESLTNQMTTMINVNDGYYYTLPARWVGNIAILKDTENRLREIYRYNASDMTVGDKLFYIKAVDIEAWKAGEYSGEGVSEITRNDETAFICYISKTAALEGLTLEEIKSDFKLRVE
ncbi:MAG: hypothetical protein IKD04_10040 [Clostridia bacterium]|nr:hypothetical protein [Clostridia bacterium]